MVGDARRTVGGVVDVHEDMLGPRCRRPVGLQRDVFEGDRGIPHLHDARKDGEFLVEYRRRVIIAGVAHDEELVMGDECALVDGQSERPDVLDARLFEEVEIREIVHHVHAVDMVEAHALRVTVAEAVCGYVHVSRAVW